MRFGIGTYSFGGFASFLGLGPTLEEKFKMIKSLGFGQVELLKVDLENNSTEDIKRWAAENDLEIVSVHADPTEEIIKKMAELGGKAVICAGTPFNCKEEAIEVAKWLDEMAEIAEPYGIKIGYHNHSQEFYMDEGKALLEHLLDNSTKCFSQLDCGWAMNGGMYPPYFIRKYRNRILAIHVKENSKVAGPGPKPASRKEPPRMPKMGNPKDLPLEERQKILAGFEARAKESGARFDPQCKMGADISNIDWKEIRAALNEQDFEAFWIVEREGFYDEHDKCLAEDSAWLTENIK